MSNGVSAIISSVYIAIASAAGVAGFSLYTDVQLLKNQTMNMEKSMDEREETTKRFTAMMLQMDKTLAVQNETVNTIKDAIKRLESRDSYSYRGEEYDRRN